jgi:mannose-6-phosphate isomerase-like protein (cupin superfamily)
MGKMRVVYDITWESVKEAAGGLAKLAEYLSGSDLAGMLNWTMLPWMSGIWEGMLTEAVPLCEFKEGQRPLFFFDIADPQKRTAGDIKEALALMGRFNGPFRTVLGLNEKESHQIARVLGVRLGTFLDDQTELNPVVSRKKDYRDNSTIRFADNAAVAHTHMEYHSLSQDKAGRHMEPFLIEISPVENADFALSSHEGEEFIYVLEGAIEISYGTTSYILEKGDSIYYDSIIAHHVHSKKGTSAKIMGIVYTPF